MKKITLKIPHADLKNRHREIREQQSKDSSIRIHRAISWLQQIDQIELLDLAFIQLWISFNAAYAGDFEQKESERTKLSHFFKKIVELDKNGDLNKILFSKFSGAIRTLIDNKFAFEPFWQALRNHDSSDNWKIQFTDYNKKTMKVMMQGDTQALLTLIFDRIYTIRNQLLHGGATCASTINRNQLEDACQILADIIPMIIQIMIDNACKYCKYPIYNTEIS